MIRSRPSPRSKSHYCGCLYFSANALGRIMNEVADSAFARTTLSGSNAFIVMTVNRSPGVTIGEIAQVHLLDQSTVSRLVERLESGGWVRRERESRLVRVYPDRRADDAQKDLLECWETVFKRYSDLLGVRNARALTASIADAFYALDAGIDGHAKNNKERS